MKTSFIRGHSVVFKNNEWQYSDTGAKVDGESHRPCTKCGKASDSDSDPCLGDLPGVDNACCGHGVRKMAYIQFINGVVIKGFDVVEYTNKLNIPVFHK